MKPLRVIAMLLVAATANAGPIPRSIKVIDSAGQPVGLLLDGTTVVRRIVDTGNFVVFSLGTDRLEGAALPVFNHETSDCSGARWVEASEVLTNWSAAIVFPASAGSFAGRIFAAGSPFRRIDRQSLERGDRDAPACAGDGGTVLLNGLCCVTDANPNIQVGPATELTLPTFIAPFTAK